METGNKMMMWKLSKDLWEGPRNEAFEHRTLCLLSLKNTSSLKNVLNTVHFTVHRWAGIKRKKSEHLLRKKWCQYNIFPVRQAANSARFIMKQFSSFPSCMMQKRNLSIEHILQNIFQCLTHFSHFCRTDCICSTTETQRWDTEACPTPSSRFRAQVCIWYMNSKVCQVPMLTRNV